MYPTEGSIEGKTIMQSGASTSSSQPIVRAVPASYLVISVTSLEISWPFDLIETSNKKKRINVVKPLRLLLVLVKVSVGFIIYRV